MPLAGVGDTVSGRRATTSRAGLVSPSVSSPTATPFVHGTVFTPDGSVLTPTYLTDRREDFIRVIFLTVVLCIFSRNILVAAGLLLRTRRVQRRGRWWRRFFGFFGQRTPTVGKVKHRALLYLLLASQLLGPFLEIVELASEIDWGLNCTFVRVSSRLCYELSWSLMISGVLGIKTWLCMGKPKWLLAVLAAATAAWLALFTYGTFVDIPPVGSLGECEQWRPFPSASAHILLASLFVLFGETVLLAACLFFVLLRSARSARIGRRSVSHGVGGDEATDLSGGRGSGGTSTSGRWTSIRLPIRLPCNCGDTRGRTHSETRSRLKRKVSDIWMDAGSLEKAHRRRQLPRTDAAPTAVAQASSRPPNEHENLESGARCSEEGLSKHHRHGTFLKSFARPEGRSAHEHVDQVQAPGTDAVVVEMQELSPISPRTRALPLDVSDGRMSVGRSSAFPYGTDGGTWKQGRVSPQESSDLLASSSGSHSRTGLYARAAHGRPGTAPSGRASPPPVDTPLIVLKRSADELEAEEKAIGEPSMLSSGLSVGPSANKGVEGGHGHHLGHRRPTTSPATFGPPPARSTGMGLQPEGGGGVRSPMRHGRLRSGSGSSTTLASMRRVGRDMGVRLLQSVDSLRGVNIPSGGARAQARREQGEVREWERVPKSGAASLRGVLRDELLTVLIVTLVHMVGSAVAIVARREIRDPGASSIFYDLNLAICSLFVVSSFERMTRRRKAQNESLLPSSGGQNMSHGSPDAFGRLRSPRPSPLTTSNEAVEPSARRQPVDPLEATQGYDESDLQKVAMNWQAAQHGVASESVTSRSIYGEQIPVGAYNRTPRESLGDRPFFAQAINGRLAVTHPTAASASPPRRRLNSASNAIRTSPPVVPFGIVHDRRRSFPFLRHFSSSSRASERGRQDSHGSESDTRLRKLSIGTDQHIGRAAMVVAEEEEVERGEGTMERTIRMPHSPTMSREGLSGRSL